MKKKLKFILITTFLITIFLTALSANPLITRKNKFTYVAPVVAGRLPFWLISAQQDVKNKMAVLFKDIKTGEGFSAYLFLMTIAFVYGLLHAAGPGHRKGVIFSLFISKKAQWWEPLYAGLLLAVLHAFVSVILILAIKLLAGRILSVFVEQATVYLELLSYSLLILAVVILLLYKIINIIKQRKHKNSQLLKGQGLYSTVIISGLVPCPGAAIIMIFAVTLGMIWQGVLAVAAMSLGMGLTISLAGYLAFFSKESLFSMLKKREDLVENLGLFLELAGLLMVLLFSLFMLYPLLTR